MRAARFAKYYPHKKDLSTAALEAKGKAQWAWARQLAQEWEETEAAGKVFKLNQGLSAAEFSSKSFLSPADSSIPADMIAQLKQLLPGRHIPTSSPMTDMGGLWALIGAANAGDSMSPQRLEALFPEPATEAIT